MVPASGWAHTDSTNSAIKLTSGNFVNNDSYEFSYVAKNPIVNRLGFAAIRDFDSFLRTTTIRPTARSIRVSWYPNVPHCN